MADLLKMPEVVAGNNAAILVSWNKELREEYRQGDPLVTVETEKAVVDVEAESDGVLLHLLAEPGATVSVGAPIALVGRPGEVVSNVDGLLSSLGESTDTITEDTVIEDSPEVLVSADAPAPPDAYAGVDAELVSQRANTTAGSDVAPELGNRRDASARSTAGRRIFASPLARKLVDQAGLDIEQLTGTGPHGRIRRIDVEKAVAERDRRPPAGPTPRGVDSERVDAAPTEFLDVAVAAPVAPVAPVPASSNYVDQPVDRIRQVVARRMTESKQTAPHFYLRGSANVDRLLELRRELNEMTSVKISINDLIVKAVARAHTQVPELNVAWNGSTVRRFSQVDVAIAVATPHGLFAPVIRSVDSLSIAQLASASRLLTQQANDQTLQQADLTGGSITVSNLGMYGVEEFTAIINPPQAAILAVGAVQPSAVVRSGVVGVASVLRVTMAVDHRPVDGATAALWMRTFLELVQNPLQILV